MAISVIGVGVSRSGTQSLRRALDALGLGPSFDFTELLGARRDLIPLCEKAMGESPHLWADVLQNYNATCGTPCCFFYRDLSEMFPEAKFVLNVRDPDQWYESMRATVADDEWMAFLDSGPTAKMRAKWWYADVDWNNRKDATDRYRQHLEDVDAAIDDRRLLRWEAAMGWEPLCDFLGTDVPDMPFPRVNSREEMLASMKRIRGGDSTR